MAENFEYFEDNMLVNVDSLGPMPPSPLERAIALQRANQPKQNNQNTYLIMFGGAVLLAILLAESHRR